MFLIATNVSFYLLIGSKCNNNDTYQNGTSDSYNKIDTPGNILGSFLQVLLYSLFAYNVVYKGIIKHEDYIEKFCKRSVKTFLLTLLLLAAVVISVADATLSHYRDVEFVSGCGDEAVQNYEAYKLFFALHAAAKAFSFFYVLVVSLSSIHILYSAAQMWKEGINSMHKATVSFDDSEIVVEKSRTKLYTLYVNYIKVGKKISLRCNALRQWFLMMYLVSFIFLLLDLTHISDVVQEIAQPRSILGISATVANVVVYGVAFFAPYFMAFRLNEAHKDYHEKLIDTHQGLEIVMGGNKYEFTPGSSLVVSKIDEEEEQTGEVGELTLLLQSKGEEAEVETQLQTKVTSLEEKFREYFDEVPKSLILAKVAAFDFVPSFFYVVSIPLDSLLNTFTIITSLLSFILISGLFNQQS